MPELGQVNREQAAALAGLAPFVQQSGRWKGEAHIAGAASAARSTAALRWNAALKALYRRLVERGKAHTVASVACARELLDFANTVLARGTPRAERPITPYWLLHGLDAIHPAFATVRGRPVYLLRRRSWNVPWTRHAEVIAMIKQRYIYRQDDDAWPGYLDEFPKHWIQGETEAELKEHLIDLYKELTSGAIPNVRRVAELDIA